MSWYDTLLQNLPQVEGPQQKKLDFTVKLKWTLIVLALFYILTQIPLYGLGQSALAQFEALSVILGAEFGSLVSLGIGPIVTASIVLQLLNGSGLVKFNTNTAEGKARFQGTNKLMSYGFLIFESIIYVIMGGLAPAAELAGTSTYAMLETVLILQLIFGGFIIILLDDLVSKWGLGSGISLFIAAGVAKSLFIKTFSMFASPSNPEYVVGAIPTIFQALSNADFTQILLSVAAILATIFVFGLAVYFQSMKVEIPLSFGRVRGYGMRWPLNFLYTSNTPVILIAALLANVQLGAALLNSKFGLTQAQSIANWFQAPPLLTTIISSGTLNIGWTLYAQALFYMCVIMLGALVFSWFWMQSSGMDAHSQAKQIMNSGLQIPGFRNDPRIMEHILARYIGPLTIMGGLTVGFLAAIADISGALTSGTGLLLTIMIVYRLYEDVARQHMTDMNPMMKKFMGGR
ncbi:MAG TPA: preprotein translocase subunit SecY [Acidobacteriota bacterium]|nr:preprotein translocase subunit SecY [Acidobacteriota bacterium]